MPQLDLGNLDPGEIGRLMKLLADTDVDECEIQQGEYSLSIKRNPFYAPSHGAESVAESVAHAEPAFVPSPAVGVFHRSEDRDDPEDIESGKAVQSGEVLGIIEVMGVPHPVVATRDGVVGEFLVEDGEPVEYGQPIVSYQS